MQEKFKLKSFEESYKFLVYKSAYRALIPRLTEERIEQMAMESILEDREDEKANT